MAQVLLFLVFILSLIFSFNVHAEGRKDLKNPQKSRVIEILNEAKVKASKPIVGQVVDSLLFNLSITCMLETDTAENVGIVKAECGYVQLEDSDNASVDPVYFNEEQSKELATISKDEGIKVIGLPAAASFPESAWVNSAMTFELLVDANADTRKQQVTLQLVKLP